MSKSQSQSRSGQSLIEAIVALSVLTAGFLGIMTLLSKSFQLNRVNGDQVKATYLAAEGVELMKNFMDHLTYESAAEGVGGTPLWATKCFASNGHYMIDYKTYDCSTLLPSASAVNGTLYLDPTTGLYSANAAAGTATPFKRDILVTRRPYEIDVVSSITWTTNGVAAQTVSLEDHFYQWNPVSL